MYRTVFWTLSGRELRAGLSVENDIETCKLPCVERIFASQVQCMIQRCSWVVLRMSGGCGDGEGGARGFQDGEYMYIMADSCQCMSKPVQYCKVKEKKDDYFPKEYVLIEFNKK